MRELTFFDYFIGYGFLLIGLGLLLRLGWIFLCLLAPGWLRRPPGGDPSDQD